MITPLYLTSKAAGPRLRVAVLLDGATVPRYVAAILEDIARSSFARVELAIVVRSGEGARARGLPALAQDLYDVVDRAVAGDRDPLVRVDPGPWLRGVDRLEVTAGGDGDLELSPEVLADVERRGLDVILRFCDAFPRGGILRAARAGIWSYHFGADESPRGGAPFFREVAEGAATLDVQLEAQGGGAGTRLVLCRSTFSSQGSMFVAHHRQVPIWETTHFVLWKLHDLHERGWDHLRRQALVPSTEAPARAAAPTAAEMARFLVPRLASGVARRLKPQPAEVVHRWCIAIRRTASPLHAERGLRSAGDFRWLDAPRGHYWADPFLFAHGGKTWLFCEDFVYDRGFAGISRAEVAPDGTVGPMEMCLDPGFHLSFPHVFAHEGEVFMIPESLSNGTVTLYRAKRFPDVWVQEKVLFEGNAADTALWHEGGKFYFFTTLFDRDDRGMKTFLFVADALTGAWRMHPENPVSSDVRNARGAGAMFRRDGRFFRPVQNCGPHYGYGFQLEEILALDEERYEARPYCWVDPTQVTIPARGVHTYNQCGDLEVIDSFTVGPRPA
jgi:hypothetical protein